jgi:amino acid adenylation domain-containing protein
LTYAELHDRAERVAARLMHGRAAAPERVAFVAARTVSAYVGYLAVHRLGAGIVPLAPDHPAHRSLDVAQRAGIEVAVVGEGVANPFLELPQRFRPTTVTVGDGVDPVVDAPGGPGRLPPPRTDTDGEAYLLFTSGTQGRPKGVPIRHRQFSPYLAHNIRRFEVTPDARLSQVFGLTFDASVADMFMAWGGGAALVVPSREDVFRPVDFIVRHRLTHWFSAPSAIRVAHALGNLPRGVATTLRHSMFGAEPVMLTLMRLWREVAPNTDVWNLYGPTETAVNCTEHRLTGDATHWRGAANGTLPIGVMYPGMEALVLGPDRLPADDGELCLRGDQRFDGYLDPAENVGRFLTFDGTAPAIVQAGPEPPTPEQWYRTGDRVSREAEGVLVHRGRLDQQVKIMGHRVEIGEVEAGMQRHPQVRDAAVVAVRADDDTQLVGVYVGHVEPVEFEHWLRRQLPAPMVPARMVRVDALPLNENGKVDRARLTRALSSCCPADRLR